MRRFVSCYHVFVPQIYERIFIYLVYPALLIGLGCRFKAWGMPLLICELVCCSLILVAEFMFDITAFGGIASEDTNKLEYLKTSVKGMEVLRKSIISDAVRRVCSVAIIMLAVHGAEAQLLTWMQIIAGIFATVLCIEVGLIITRRFTIMTFVYLSMVVIGFVAMYVCLKIFLETISVTVVGGIIILYIAVAVLGRVMIMRKARGSYYDGRN